MQPLAKAYAGVVIVLGALTMTVAYTAWHCESLLRFSIYLAMTALGSGLKIRLPMVNGTMSVNFFFVLVGIAQLSLGETVAIGACGFLVQVFWRPRSKPKPIQVAFNLSIAAVAADVAWRTFQWSVLREAEDIRALP